MVTKQIFIEFLLYASGYGSRLWGHGRVCLEPIPVLCTQVIRHVIYATWVGGQPATRGKCISQAETWRSLREKSGKATRKEDDSVHENPCVKAGGEEEYHILIPPKPLQLDWSRVSPRDRDGMRLGELGRSVLMSAGRQGKAMRASRKKSS